MFPDGGAALVVPNDESDGRKRQQVLLRCLELPRYVVRIGFDGQAKSTIKVNGQPAVLFGGAVQNSAADQLKREPDLALDPRR
jgi:hypothetical protein